ncbi:hypothetical protein NHQ30_006404 [Ciborinia camelliae]|nr:hypothetical protein NHQ30_006404 [Ciborinia camelliae]
MQICASIPATKAFFVIYIPKFFNSQLSRTTGNSLGSPTFTTKGSALSSPGFGVKSTSEFHSQPYSNSNFNNLSRESSRTPLSAEHPIHDHTVGASAFELSSFTSTSRGDEEMGGGGGGGGAFGPASFVSSGSNININSIGRAITGSVRRDKERDRDGENLGAASSQNTSREKVGERGWDIHIGVVKTLEVEEEFKEQRPT